MTAALRTFAINELTTEILLCALEYELPDVDNPPNEPGVSRDELDAP